MESDLFRRQATWYGGRGLFATQPISKDTLLHTCPFPYASVIYRVFRKEVCGLCFAYAFDAGRNAWNIKLENGTGIWFCSEGCRDRWIRDESSEIVPAMNAAIDKLAKMAEKKQRSVAADSARIFTEIPKVESLTQDFIDEAWVIAENSAATQLPTLSEMELDTVRFVLSAILRRHAEDSGLQKTMPSPLDSWPALLELQNNELHFYRARPHALPSNLRIYAFIRRIVLTDVPALATYLATFETVHAVLARDPGNVFGMYEMNEEGDSEMLGWCMYVSASYFNHDCAPNVRKKRMGRELHFFATRDIAPGEELCTNYIDVKDTVTDRRKELAANWYFDCVCDRCKRELGATDDN
ncbi:protein lysine methyltransferase [Favolaschia claudopus]|uniref:Protein lysine methyltransferase n=1 Tax=Favolaschia claudopus TaxID=2862362 RepID=A0AAW0DM86_9AGAR